MCYATSASTLLNSRRLRRMYKACSLSAELSVRHTCAACRYLSDVESDAGGETALPLADALDSEAQSTQTMSDCANRMGIAVRPRKVGKVATDVLTHAVGSAVWHVWGKHAADRVLWGVQLAN
jgi:hypothetical protein